MSRENDCVLFITFVIIIIIIIVVTLYLVHGCDESCAALLEAVITPSSHHLSSRQIPSSAPALKLPGLVISVFLEMPFR